MLWRERRCLRANCQWARSRDFSAVRHFCGCCAAAGNTPLCKERPRVLRLSAAREARPVRWVAGDGVDGRGRDSECAHPGLSESPLRAIVVVWTIARSATGRQLHDAHGEDAWTAL